LYARGYAPELHGVRARYRRATGIGAKCGNPPLHGKAKCSKALIYRASAHGCRIARSIAKRAP
jgi:hypothetical protein